MSLITAHGPGTRDTAQSPGRPLWLLSAVRPGLGEQGGARLPRPQKHPTEESLQLCRACRMEAPGGTGAPAPGLSAGARLGHWPVTSTPTSGVHVTKPHSKGFSGLQWGGGLGAPPWAHPHQKAAVGAKWRPGASAPSATEEAACHFPASSGRAAAEADRAGPGERSQRPVPTPRQCGSRSESHRGARGQGDSRNTRRRSRSSAARPATPGGTRQVTASSRSPPCRVPGTRLPEAVAVQAGGRGKLRPEGGGLCNQGGASAGLGKGQGLCAQGNEVTEVRMSDSHSP